MKITGKTEVQIEPLGVIEKLLHSELGRNGYITTDPTGHYLVKEVNRGSHSTEEKVFIGVERYAYIKSLEIVKEYLRKKL